MRTHLLLLTLCLAACGPQLRPHFTTSLGVTVYDLTDGGMHLTKESASAMDEWLVEEMSHYGYEPKRSGVALRQVTGQVVDGSFKCFGRPGYCVGQDLGLRIILKDYDCPWWSAYRHELTHVIQEANGVLDDNHKRPEWATVERVEGECGAPENSP